MLKLVSALALSIASTLAIADQLIKKSSSEICHSPDSSHYKRTVSYTPYSTLEDCLTSGGRLPSGYSRGKDSETQQNSYSREKFGAGWGDSDNDCQDSRQEALIAQSTAPVRFQDNKSCRVASGRWLSPYTGEVIHDPKAIDIDHVVPLKWAWEHGAKAWTNEKRIRLANDPANLLSVEASLNRQKGAKGPEEWLPPANQCQYLSRFYRITLKYDLKLLPDEEKFRRVALDRCLKNHTPD